MTPPIASELAQADRIKQFLDALFSAKEPSEYLLVWLLDGRRSTWFTDTDKAAEFVRSNAGRDVYVGVALSPADHGPHLRLKIEGGERMPTSIVGLWADIDIADEVHKKHNLAPTVDDARTVLFPDLPPTILLHSGGGLQAWWLFREPYSLASEEGARKGGALATRWIRALRARAAARGWDIDSVGDLTRVMRVPSTSNCKIPGQPRPVRLIDINDYRYNPSELDEYLDTIGAEQVSRLATPKISGEKLVYGGDAEPPAEKFAALLANDPRFTNSWHRRRRDLKDQSASSYDMALANVAVQAGWTDQDIANLLIAHRRRFGEDLKLRDSYYAKTITRARTAFPAPMPTPVSPQPDGPVSADVGADDRASALQHISSLLHREVALFLQFGRERPTYSLTLVGGTELKFGSATELRRRDVFEDRAFEQGILLTVEKKYNWSTVLQSLLRIVEVRETLDPVDQIRSALVEYVRSSGVAAASLSERSQQTTAAIECLAEGRPVYETGGDRRVCLKLENFKRWVEVNSERIKMKDISTLLARAGFRPVGNMAAKHHETGTSIFVYRVWRGRLTTEQLAEVANRCASRA